MRHALVTTAQLVAVCRRFDAVTIRDARIKLDKRDILRSDMQYNAHLQTKPDLRDARILPVPDSESAPETFRQLSTLS
jgi:hypothetical protein